MQTYAMDPQTLPELPNEIVAPPPRSLDEDLLPWADPYLTKLLAQHRLQAALNDSLVFIDGQRQTPSPRREPPPTPAWQE